MLRLVQPVCVRACVRASVHACVRVQTHFVYERGGARLLDGLAAARLGVEAAGPAAAAPHTVVLPVHCVAPAAIGPARRAVVQRD